MEVIREKTEAFKVRVFGGARQIQRLLRDDLGVVRVFGSAK